MLRLRDHEQQFHALMAENGVLDLTAQPELAARIRSHLDGPGR